jgi:beta-glucanase (GH16 family)
MARRRFFVVCRLFLAGSGSLAILAAFAASSIAQVPDLPGWQLSWHDEFDGAAVDTSAWNLITKGDNFNNELEYYLPQQATINNGNLRITATNQAITQGGITRNYRSARLESKATFGPGRFEARIDLPAGKGMWPAFWLNANAVQWPLGGEIDIMENKGSQPTDVSSAFHYQKNPGPCCSQHFYVVKDYVPSPAVNFQAGFHTYAAEWDTNQIRFSVDGNQFFVVNKNTSTMSDANFTTVKNIILNLAVGGDFDGDPNGATSFPQYMDVDYVRVWQHQTGLLGDYNGDHVVDAADYTVWQDSLGQSGIGLAADGSGNGTVDMADYTMWQSHYGATSGGSGAGSTTAVPEPSSFLLAAMAATGLVWRGRLRRQ